jgi:hypothetical protein
LGAGSTPAWPSFFGGEFPPNPPTGVVGVRFCALRKNVGGSAAPIVSAHHPSVPGLLHKDGSGGVAVLGVLSLRSKRAPIVSAHHPSVLGLLHEDGAGGVAVLGVLSLRLKRSRACPSPSALFHLPFVSCFSVI